jgi:biopolymer transport protein ExbB
MKRLIAAAFLLTVALPGPALAWWNDDWGHRQQITVNGGQRGVTEKVDRAAVLVRLHGGVIDFANLKDDGADLRFVAGDDKTPLNFHVERFDKAANMALVWVDVPDIQAGQAKTIWLYYGNQKAAPVGKASATYDANQSLVLHFSEGAGAPADATANANRVTALTSRPAADGLIAGAMSFAATSDLHVAPSQSLTPANGAMTLSAWVRPGAEGAQPDAAVFTKFTSAGAGRLIVGVRDGAPYVRLVSAPLT